MKAKSEAVERISKLAAGKPAALFGCGASARAAAELLEACGVECEFYQQPGSAHAAAGAAARESFGKGEAQRHALAVYSPAFRPDHEWITAARENGLETLCEPDLGALAFGGKIIAVTGTDGKTTTASFLGRALKSAGADAFCAGNIGVPLSKFCAEFVRSGECDADKIAVCELSSFQTAALSRLRPDALIWTNFAEDHLDWHRDMREYFLSKFNLVKMLRADKFGKMIFACGSDVPRAARKFGVCMPEFARVLDFESARGRARPPAPPPFDTFAQSQNFALAETLWREMGLDESILRGAADGFRLPAYRFGEKTTVGGVDFYNDSKATNAHSAIAALTELSGRETLVWIGGGKDKSCSLEELVGAVEKCAKAAVLIGQTAPALKARLEGLPLGAHVCDTLEHAVQKAYRLCRSKSGAAVLFSPGFSSFGMFSGYGERGKSFDDALLCLKNFK